MNYSCLGTARYGMRRLRKADAASPISEHCFVYVYCSETVRRGPGARARERCVSAANGATWSFDRDIARYMILAVEVSRR